MTSKRKSSLSLGATSFHWGTRTYVMGILNVTPDSFSGDGLLVSENPIDQTVRQAQLFAEQGADVLDIGGHSTRPGADAVSESEELERVVPTLTALTEAVDLPLSIDTFRAIVAEAALDSGASLVNDVWALRADPAMAPLLAERAVPVVLMHNRSKPANAELDQRLGGRYIGVEYESLLGDIRNELKQSIDIAINAGIEEDNIILDPGIGFGKTVPQNLELLNRLDAFTNLGFPIMIGPSRKSFIGYSIDLPVDQRLEGTAASVAVGITRGADIIRVHDVQTMVRTARMTDAIVRSSKPASS